MGKVRLGWEQQQPALHHSTEHSPSSRSSLVLLLPAQGAEAQQPPPLSSLHAGRHPEQQDDGLGSEMGTKEADLPLEPSRSCSPCQTVLVRLSPGGEVQTCVSSPSSIRPSEETEVKTRTPRVSDSPRAAPQDRHTLGRPLPASLLCCWQKPPEAGRCKARGFLQTGSRLPRPGHCRSCRTPPAHSCQPAQLPAVSPHQHTGWEANN